MPCKITNPVDKASDNRCMQDDLTVPRPHTKTELFPIGHTQKQNYFPLATHKNKTIFRWLIAKTKLFSIGPWLFYDHEKPLAGGSGGGSGSGSPPGETKSYRPGG